MINPNSLVELSCHAKSTVNVSGLAVRLDGEFIATKTPFS
jgi:hypothetical protein